MRYLWVLFLCSMAIGQSTVSGNAVVSGNATIGANNQGPPLPTGALACSSLTPNQGSTITCTYASTNAATCTISNGILPSTFACNGTTTPFVPPFSSPGPTCTPYILTVTNASGVVQSTQTTCTIAIVTSGDDSTYSTGTSETCAYPGGVTTDGPATLPKVCNYTPLSATPSPGMVRVVGCSTSNCVGGTLTSGTCLSDWNTAMAALVAGDVVKIAQGCSISCPSSTGCVLPHINGDWTHWTLIEVVDPATGSPDVGFPAEGKRISPCDINVASKIGYPDWSVDCTARGGPKVRTAKFLTTGITAPALTTDNQVTPTCPITFPCLQFLRFQGLEFTNIAGNRTSHKLFETDGCDHCIVDRIIAHSQDDPLFRVEVQGGVSVNGSHISVMNSFIYDIMCANAPAGATCVDSQAIGGGVGFEQQVGQKIVNNFLASAGEAWFWGGSTEGFWPTADNPDGTVSDVIVRRNHTFHPLTWFLPYLAVGQTAGTTPHWDTKNLGETKATRRALWEGNISENSWEGFQSDQTGAGYLANSKSQNSKMTIPSGDVVTGSTSAGNFFVNCTNGGVACSSVSAAKSLFICEQDPNAVPDWHGTGTTVASCGSMVAFGCTAAGSGNGLQANCPGSYAKVCSSIGSATNCAVLIGSLATGTYYHILNVISGDQVQVQEDASTVVAAAPTLYKRGLNPHATVKDLTIRYNIIRHTANGMEMSSSTGDGGSTSQGTHLTSIHDNELYDVSPVFWQNANNCCNSGSFVKMFSGTDYPAIVPSDMSIIHNTAAVIGYASSSAAGLLNMFDTKCKNPVAFPTCSGGVSPAYFPNIKIKDNISAAAMNTTANGSNMSTDTQAFGFGLYGCSGNNGVTGCTFDVQKNLVPIGVWSGQTSELPNLHLLGSNTVEACSCTTVANGGTCTAGSPNTWSAPVTSGSLDACDRNPASGYATIFNVWDPNGGPGIDLQLPANSPYLHSASDGGALGADIPTILTKTANVALATIFTQIAITGYIGNTSCTDASPCALPSVAHTVAYTKTFTTTLANSPFQLWTVVGGTLPPGLAVTPGTGVISGTPTTVGIYPFSMQVQDAAHKTDTQAYTLTIT